MGHYGGGASSGGRVRDESAQVFPIHLTLLHFELAPERVGRYLNRQPLKLCPRDRYEVQICKQLFEARNVTLAEAITVEQKQFIVAIIEHCCRSI